MTQDYQAGCSADGQHITVQDAKWLELAMLMASMFKSISSLAL